MTEISEFIYRELFDRLPDAVMIIEGNRFVDCNNTTLEVLGYNTKKEFFMTHPSVHSPPFQPDGRDSWEKAEEMLKITHRDGRNIFEWEHKRKNGELFIVEVLLTLTNIDGRELIITSWRDLTERKKNEETIRHQAYYDSLTGLPNRILFIDRLRQAISHAKRYKRFGSVLFFDIDHFKKINDSLGHNIGDSLIIETANRIMHSIRDGDTAARLGGDEFVVLLPDLSDNDSSYAAVERIAEKIRIILSTPFHIKRYQLKITVSIGISIFTGTLRSYEDVLRQADMAMYRSKSEGKNRVSFFLPSMQAEVFRRLSLERDLSSAFENGELYLSYQPQYVAEERIYGVEALIRWEHSDKGNISPLEFIPVAEDIGLIVPIGEWVLKQAMTDIKRVTSSLRNTEKMRLSVNLSPIQFRQEEFISKIKSIVLENGFPAELLTLEITENVIIDNIEDTIEKCLQLKEIGIRISLDDFGTGYSSLSYLKQLPIDEIKIDKSFIRDIEYDKDDAILVQTIISMAHQFGLKLIAEGVETKEQLDFLGQHNCDAYQGYYFSRPMHIDELSQLFEGIDHITGSGRGQ